MAICFADLISPLCSPVACSCQQLLPYWKLHLPPVLAKKNWQNYTIPRRNLCKWEIGQEKRPKKAVKNFLKEEKKNRTDITCPTLCHQYSLVQSFFLHAKIFRQGFQLGLCLHVILFQFIVCALQWLVLTLQIQQGLWNIEHTAQWTMNSFILLSNQQLPFVQQKSVHRIVFGRV